MQSTTGFFISVNVKVVAANRFDRGLAAQHAEHPSRIGQHKGQEYLHRPGT